MIAAYNIILLVFCAPVFLFLLVSQRQRFLSEFLFRYRERLGTWDRSGEKGDGRPVLWFHCASLGEVRAVEPLLGKFPEYRVLLTTVTLSGREYAEKNRLADNLFFAPLDFSFLVSRAVRPFKPKALVLVETELWPGLINAAKRAGAKVVVVNARLSAHSFPFYRNLGFFWKRVLGDVDRLYARSEEDAARFAALGVRKDTIILTGNIKYDRESAAASGSRDEYRLAGSDFVWVCGSTRPGEEEILADVYVRLKERYGNLKLVIAPRHIERVPEIRVLLAKKRITNRLRSDAEDVKGECMIVDTFGELQKLYALSDIAFVGGSLVNKGGQNPIEPASAGRPVIFGPHMDNFVTEARVLEERGGGVRVADAAAYVDTMERFLSDAVYRNTCGRSARKAVESQKGALQRTADAIHTLLQL